MADDKSKRGKADRIRVAGGERYEVAYEAKKTGKSTAAIKKAIKSAGPMRTNVEKKLRGK